MSNKEISIKYANEILDGTIPASLLTKQSVKRYLDDLSNPLYIYKEEEVDKVVEFINSLYLTEQVTQKHFYLADWQTFIIANLYGLCYKESGLRKYKYGYIELARKNGKSQLITALALYDLIFGIDSQVVISANSLRQVKDVDFKKVKQFCDQLDKKQKHLVQYYNSVKYGNSELLVTATSPDKLDGLNISFSIIDEFHEAKDGKMYNVFKSALGGREQPLFLIITTAGFNRESFCYQLRSYYAEVLAGAKIDQEQFILIYTIDEGDDIEDKSTWVKANPNLDISLKSNFLKSEINKALNNEIEKNSVMVKHLNVWMKNNTVDIWLPDTLIDSAMKSISINDDMFNGLDCWVGYDGSSVSDITSVSYMIQLDEFLYFFNDLYIPEDSINTNFNKDLYKSAATRGEINITSGNVIDTDHILKDILNIHKRHEIIQLNYDKWNSTQFAIDATEAGLNLKPYSQLPGNLNKPLKEFEILIKSGRLIIQTNSLTKWMMGNVLLKINQMGNYSLDKSNRMKKIDVCASMINALGGYLESPRYNGFGAI